MRHKQNKDNNKHKQERSQNDDVDEQQLGDQMPEHTAAIGVRVRQRFRVRPSKRIRASGTGLARMIKDESGSGLEIKQLRRRDQPSTNEENIAACDVRFGLCYFPICIRQMLYSYLDQAITQTSLFA